ncbi:chromosome segregation protein SMC [Abyssisolibacter fermentans]|uniref:chromosome segregation protein SMC n=1 Tax=Abyssisolibacter fermentans TaxID=1766203 RepID=UPI000831DB37|nr:chromosome segregation protein SMC [Abyssisolibacter fermentans]
MYLKRIELNGFKSFADKTTIEFKKGVTGVVGPNGSGKSNISDSIRWVLGEQSAKTLRGGKMEDVIFSGTATRKPLGFAEITLVLDNKEKTLPLDYSEVNITRRVFRSGDSEYYINKTSCRLKDIKELFMDTGVGIDGYSIIGQGRIDEILSTKSEDRRNLFEEAAGIVKYKTRKKEAERKLEKTKDNLLRIDDIVYELEKQIGPLESQSKKAKKYNELSENLKSLEVNLFIHEIESIEEKKDVLNKQIESLQKQKNIYTIESEKSESKCNEYKAEIDKIDKKIEDNLNFKYDMQSKVEKKEGDILLLNERNIFLKSENERLKKEIDLTKSSIQRDVSEKETLLADIELLEKDIAEMEVNLHSSTENLVTVQKLIDENDLCIEEKKTQLIHNLNLVAEKKSKINMMETFNKNIDKRIEQLTLEIEAYEKEIDEKNKNISLNIRNKEEAENNLNITHNNIDNYIDKKTSLISEYDTIKQKMDNIKSELQGSISRYKLLKDMKNEYDGFYKSVKNILLACKNNYTFSKGVKGVVAELLKVDKKYERAIEIALGSGIQNVVTENDSYAKSAIEYLKKNKLGRVTFLPLNLIKGNRIYGTYNTNGVLGLACDLITYDNKYKNIFEYLLGRTIIVDNLDNGIKLLKNIKQYAKIVTLDGDVLNPAGSITGGSYNKKNTSLLSRKRIIDELGNKIQNGKEEYKKLEKKSIDIQNTINEIKTNISNNKLELDGIKVQIINIENELKKDKENLSNIQLSINKLNEQNKTLLEENIGSRYDLEKLKVEINEINCENEKIKSSIETLEKDNEIKREDYQQKNQNVIDTRLKLASSIQNKKHIKENTNKLDEMSNKNQQDLEIKHKLLEENNQKIQDNVLLQDKYKEEKDNMNSTLEEFTKSLNEYKEEKENCIEIFEKEKNKLKGITSKLSEYNEELSKIDLKSEKYNIQLENYNNKLWEQYEMSYQMALNYKEEIENINIIKNEVGRLKKSIKALGNINIDSIQQFVQVKERYEFITKQRNDLIHAKSSLNKVITDMEINMKDKFKANFLLIKKHFNEVFIKLFGGGKADIYLQNEEEVLTTGIEIIAQPPGKKLQNIMLLSGGEKALTAIALLFAILKLKPTPFCILDEIEAALDDANVYRFADYLKDYSSNTQFIVITHRKGTMEAVDTLYGVTMEEKGVSKVISLKLTDILDEKVS